MKKGPARVLFSYFVITGLLVAILVAWVALHAAVLVVRTGIIAMTERVVQVRVTRIAVLWSVTYARCTPRLDFIRFVCLKADNTLSTTGDIRRSHCAPAHIQQKVLGVT
jgi:hypothetical protein